MTVDGSGLEAYVADVVREHQQMRAETNSVSSLREMTKRVVPQRHRGSVRMLATRALRRRERGRAGQFATDPMLHLGSGGESKAGWVNIDLAGDPVDLAWDLSRPLPFADGSVTAIFHEHVLEHLPLDLGLALTRDCYRLLKPGARLRIGVPDAGMLLHSYVGDGLELEAYSPGRPTRLLAVQETFYWHHHVTMYDEETLRLLLSTAGFDAPERREFGQTDLPLVPDTLARRHGTLYMEAVK
jgi:predicted SAM-dependent methyltransferase